MAVMNPQPGPQAARPAGGGSAAQGGTTAWLALLRLPTGGRADRALRFSGWLFLALSLPLLAATVLHDAQLFGRSVWDKPLRFALSLGSMALSLSLAAAWLAQRGQRVPGWRWLAAALVLTIAFELGYISLQSARGVDSHFRAATALEALLFGLMGVGAGFMALSFVWIGAVAAWACRHDRSAALAGVGLGFVAAGVLTAYTGESLVNVGLSQSALPGTGWALPFLGWRLDGSDPRPAHFIAVHLLQIGPALGLAVAAAMPAQRGRRAPQALVLALLLALVLAVLLLTPETVDLD